MRNNVFRLDRFVSGSRDIYLLLPPNREERHFVLYIQYKPSRFTAIRCCIINGYIRQHECAGRGLLLTDGRDFERCCQVREYPAGILAKLHLNCEICGIVTIQYRLCAFYGQCGLELNAGIFANAEVAAQAVPKCNLIFLAGEDMIEPMSTFLNTMFEIAPASVGGAVPADDFYYVG